MVTTPVQTLFQRLAFRFRRPQGPATVDVEDYRFDVASQSGSIRAMRMSGNAETLAPNVDLVAASQYVSEVSFIM